LILLYDKTLEDLILEAETELAVNNFSTTPGSLAKLFLNIINKMQSELYSTLRINHMQAFLSSATGSFIDEIGLLLNCKRNVDEEDDFYKDRISKQV
jgi:hypothetical protein